MTVAIAVALVAPTTLALSGLFHLVVRRPIETSRRVLSSSTVALLGVAECVLGTASVVAIIWSPVLRPALVVQLALMIVFTVYSAQEVQRSSTLDCGCSPLTTEMGWPVIVRNGVLTLSAALGLLVTTSDSRAVMSLAIGTVLSALVLSVSSVWAQTTASRRSLMEEHELLLGEG